MAIVHFYEKPGCVNNARQKQLLTQAGHSLIVYDLLCEPWAKKRGKLRSFFGDRPVSEWFNRSAPRIKYGDIDPETVNEDQAIELMIADPLLIRRPLLESGGNRLAGFDTERVEAWLGLAGTASRVDLETCVKQSGAEACRQ